MRQLSLSAQGAAEVLSLSFGYLVRGQVIYSFLSQKKMLNWIAQVDLERGADSPMLVTAFLNFFCQDASSEPK